MELYTNDGQSWSSGSITSQDIAPSINSGLAAIWTAYDGAPCSDCTAYNLLLAFEDSNNKLQVVNITFSDIQYRALDADPISGSGLAINLEWHAEGSPGVRLYYQKGANSLQSVDWETQYEESAPGESISP